MYLLKFCQLTSIDRRVVTFNCRLSQSRLDRQFTCTYISQGLDIPEHGEPAYPVSAYKDNQLVHHLSKLFDDVIDSSRTGNHDNNQIGTDN